MKTIIAGSRSIHNFKIVEDAIRECGWVPTEVICGCALGVDDLGDRWASERNIPVKHFPAQWRNYGRSAGIIRNRAMASIAEALIAVWDGKSRGTKNMIQEAKNKNLKVFVKIVE